MYPGGTDTDAAWPAVTCLEKNMLSAYTGQHVACKIGLLKLATTYILAQTTGFRTSRAVRLS